MGNAQKLIGNTTLAVAALLVVGLGLAGTERGPGEPTAPRQTLTREQAVEKALAAYPGRVKEVELEREHDRQVWEIEIDGADGGERELVYSADDGELLESEFEPPLP